jgi:hypothetical protein
VAWRTRVSAFSTRATACPFGRVACVTGAAFVLSGTSAHALEWSNTPVVVVSAAEDSNLHMLPAELAHDVASTTLGASTAVVGRDETLAFSFTPRVIATRYDDPAELDRNDASADVGLLVTGDRQTWSFGASYVNEGTLQSQFDSIGFAAADVSFEQTSTSVGWSRKAEHGSFDAGIGTTAVDYTADVVSPFRNNRSEYLEGGYSRRLNERSSLRFGLTHMRVAAEAGRVATVSDDLRVRWTRSFSEVLNASVGVGVLEATTDERTGAELDGLDRLDRLERTTPAVDFGVNRRWPRWLFSASGGRTIEPDGRGTVLLQDSVNVGFSRKVAQHVDLGFSSQVGRVSTVGVLYDRDFSSERVTLHWGFKRRWALDSLFEQRVEKWSYRPRANGFVSEVSITYRGG